jgi:hypothetical protein
MKQTEETARLKVVREEQQRILNENMDSIIKCGARGFGQGAISGGMLIGMALAFMLVPFIGVFMAFALILSGIAAPFVSGIMGAEQGAGKGSKRLICGKCPSCAGRLCVTVAVDDLEKYVGVDCPLCKKRFLTKGKVFLRVPPLPIIKSRIQADKQPNLTVKLISRVVSYSPLHERMAVRLSGVIKVWIYHPTTDNLE